MSLVRWKLIIEYDGRSFAGWQRQDNAPSVQQSIEEAITKFCQQELRLHAAGRTDAGVHAWGQVAHFDLDYGARALSGFELTKALNAHLGDSSVSVVSAEPVDSAFHARFGAQNKLYTYRIVNRSARPALDSGRVWHVKKPLNVDAMRDAATYFVGHHDFTTFRATECQAKSPIRTLDRLDVESSDYDTQGGVEIRVQAEARAFLHHQVRNMVGTLCLVGDGKWQPADVKSALEAKDRTRGGPTAPPDGLYLARIDY